MDSFMSAHEAPGLFSCVPENISSTIADSGTIIEKRDQRSRQTLIRCSDGLGKLPAATALQAALRNSRLPAPGL